MFQKSVVVVSRTLVPKLFLRTFRSRSNFQQNFEAVKKSRGTPLDQFKIVFAEGYLAGSQNPQQKNNWKYVFVAFLSGICFGSFFPAKGEQELKLDFAKDIVVKNSKVKTTFDDVKGVDEAKEELRDIVGFLRRPSRLARIGGKLPKGVLLVGPPGTGKTLLARAVAGEAGVPFFQISGSEFEQLYVGEGARRVRELFKIAKKFSPCVVFIDEIDSVGGKRTFSPLHPHSNQTINQLLTEMDGFVENEGVIILAATNCRDVLDEALMRRFDMEITIAPPSFSGRKDVLLLLLGKIAHEYVDVEVLARGTVGFTGSDLEKMVNRAAIKAASENSIWVTLEHILQERDRILMGSESISRVPDKSSNEITACHECGHVVVSFFTPFAKELHKVTINPRGKTLGYTAYLSQKDESYVTKSQVLANIDSLLGGRAAEELFYGPDFVTSGATDDLKKATELAKSMVAHWGMSGSKRLRVATNEKDDDVQKEVEQILQESYERALLLLRNHEKQFNDLKKALLNVKTLNADEIKTILLEK